MKSEKIGVEKNPAYTPPEGVETTIRWGGKPVRASAKYVVLRKEERPVAEIFCTMFSLEGRATSSTKGATTTRPITFVFNGGPGAASAYLQVGGIGPKRLDFGVRGELPHNPAHLVDNKESWLHFTDLAFIDPVGTGFSRAIAVGDDASQELKQRASDEKKEFFTLQRDLESLGEAIARILTEQKRWSSPVYIAGESYGGFRVGKMVRLLQEKFGIGLSGAFLISPALEFSNLQYTDYNMTPWLGVFPSLVASAWWHSIKAEKRSAKGVMTALAHGETFARNELAPFLVDGVPSKDLYRELAKVLSLDPHYISQQAGRISPYLFVRELLKAEKKVCGLYDASITQFDPFPDRPVYNGPEPTLSSIAVPFTHGVNILLREILGFKSDREYHLLSYEVYNQWRIEGAQSLEREVQAVDDIRYGLAMNPNLVVHVSHGIFDLITPCFASKRALQIAQIPEAQHERLIFAEYLGGHMYYSWRESREALFRDASRVVAKSFSFASS